jgi:hypothetical protein
MAELDYGEPEDAKAAELKELAQCLAFAYFAAFPNIGPKHDINFFTMFSNEATAATTKPGEVINRIKATDCLSKRFPMNGQVIRKGFTVGETEKTKKETYSSLAKKVYNVAKTFISSNRLNGATSSYKFLDQKDPFVILLKNKSLDNIRSAMNISYKSDVLSAIDVIFVKKSSMTKIETNFIKYFTDPTTIIKNAASGGNNYKNVIGRYMDSGEIFPISLKLPTGVKSNISIKKVMFASGKDASDDIDPYTKFLAIILHDPSKTREYINKVVHINFDKFSNGDVLNWVFPVSLNYKNLIDPETQKPMSTYNLNFNLFAQGHSAGWNGQFDASSKQYQDTQWVGGIGITTFETFAMKYPQYKAVISKVVNYRLAVFDKMCAKFKKENPEEFKKVATEYTAARRDLATQEILYLKKKNQTTKKFFDKYAKLTKTEFKGTISLYSEYMLDVINEIRNKVKPYSGPNNTNENIIADHYAHAQLSFFMYMGGRGADLFFKQRMFMTIFGAITKKAHKLYAVDDYMGMKNIIQETIQLKRTKFVAEFSTPPHYIIS